HTADLVYYLARTDQQSVVFYCLEPLVMHEPDLVYEIVAGVLLEHSRMRRVIQVERFFGLLVVGSAGRGSRHSCGCEASGCRHSVANELSSLHDVYYLRLYDRL